ncbi:Mitochondrial ribonuclease P catalytic subunit [Trichinella pseudospiralis]
MWHLSNIQFPGLNLRFYDDIFSKRRDRGYFQIKKRFTCQLLLFCSISTDMNSISCNIPNFSDLYQTIYSFILRNDNVSNDQWQKFRIRLWGMTNTKETADCAILKTLQMKSLFQHGVSYIKYLFTIEDCYLNNSEHFDLEVAVQLMNCVLPMDKNFPQFFTEQKAVILCLCGKFEECSSMWPIILKRSIQCRVIATFFISACRYKMTRWIWSLDMEGPFNLSVSCHLEMSKHLTEVLRKDGELESLNEMDNYVKFYNQSQCITFDISSTEAFKNYFECFSKRKWTVDFGFITDKFCCSCCGVRLKELVMSDEEFNLMKTEAFRGVRFQCLPRVFSSFRNFLRKNQPFDVVVDGYNTASFGGPGSRDVQLERIIDLARSLKFELNFKNILVIVKQHFMHSDSLLVLAKLYSVSNIYASEACLIDAALNSGKDCYIVRSDMPKLVWNQFSDQCQIHFSHWQKMRWICSEQAYLNSRSQNTLQMPAPLCTNAEKNGDHGYHFRFVRTENENDDANNQTQNMMCVRILKE